MSGERYGNIRVIFEQIDHSTDKDVSESPMQVQFSYVVPLTNYKSMQIVSDRYRQIVRN